ncbi:hypothetical protein [Actinomadura viridis]|uniref:Uncharacterized protein n=1 Tax=Actinomadura viridis TaxID=58110 RepID=A0A931GKK4_9ACTN|nr:hypothetical protein [Actinomadura viridis]MBG6090963.1 hypothetical protein [Actinomadura viridis]
MTKAPPRHSRGRHAKPPSEFSVRWNRLIKGSLGGPRRRRLAVAGAGTASLALLAATAVAGFSAAGADRSPQAAVAAQKARPSAAASPEPSPGAAAEGGDGGGADGDETADVLPYLQTKDPEKKVSKYVKDVQRTGDFLRVYTDLKEGDENSEPAVSLCEWTTEYLRGGGAKPRVFIHGTSKGNGSVVLANKQSDKDDCEVGETR